MHGCTGDRIRTGVTVPGPFALAGRTRTVRTRRLRLLDHTDYHLRAAPPYRPGPLRYREQVAPTPKHSTADRLRIAEASGALSYLAGQVLTGALTEQQAVDQLHTITRDPHLLGHGLAGCLGDPGKWAADSPPVRLAAAAGVDRVEAAATWTQMHPPGARGLRLGRAE